MSDLHIKALNKIRETIKKLMGYQILMMPVFNVHLE